MLRIGLLGFGTVGRGVFQLLTQDARFKERSGLTAIISKIGIRALHKYEHETLHGAKLCLDLREIVTDPDIDVVVECLGGEHPAYELICTALKTGKRVVTANKEVVAKHLPEFLKLAITHQTDIYYEATVCGGIPIIRTLKEGLAANHVHAFYGILNGTTNFILSQIEETRREFSDVLAEAQKLGFAEADPSMDISGLDAAYKAAILCSAAFKISIPISDIFYEGIEKITLKDIDYAKELGYRIKLLGMGRQDADSISVKVHPTFIPSGHPLASVKNELNAVSIFGNAVGEVHLSGRGAGSLPTASSMVADLINIAFTWGQDISPQNRESLSQGKALPIHSSKSQFYLRLVLADHARALEKITGILGHLDISISKILQKEVHNQEAEVVIMTHRVVETVMTQAMQALGQCPAIKKIENLIRIGIEEEI